MYVSYFEYVLGHNFTYVMSKGKKKMEIYGSDIRGGSLNGWKLPTFPQDQEVVTFMIFYDVLFMIHYNILFQ
jgi:hypothetical protein